MWPSYIARSIGIQSVSLMPRRFLYVEKGAFFNYGAGSSNCTKYLGSYGSANLKRTPDGGISYVGDFGFVMGWLQGFATRVNRTIPGGANIYDMDSVELAAWVASWCRDNPLKQVVDAMDALTESRVKSLK